MFNTVGQQIAHHSEIDLRTCFTQTSVINRALLPEQHSVHLTGLNLILPQSNPNFISVADVEAEDLNDS